MDLLHSTGLLRSSKRWICVSFCPFPFTRAPVKLQVELMQSHYVTQDLGKGGLSWKLLFKREQTVLEDCSVQVNSKSTNLY